MTYNYEEERAKRREYLEKHEPDIIVNEEVFRTLYIYEIGNGIKLHFIKTKRICQRE